VLGLTAILCIAVAAGAAGAINMWYDRDIDALMRRTARRPIPAGRIAPNAALGFGLTPGRAHRRGDGARDELGGGRLARLLDRLLRRGLHDVAEAPDQRRTSSSAAPPAPSRR
jgi:hypothetical protein